MEDEKNNECTDTDIYLLAVNWLPNLTVYKNAHMT